MDANDHIGPLVVQSDLHGIPSHALLERFEAERFQRHLVHKEAERCGSKFIEPFPKKGILGHDFVQGDVLVEREERSVVLYQSRSVISFLREVVTSSSLLSPCRCQRYHSGSAKETALARSHATH